MFPEEGQISGRANDARVDPENFAQTYLLTWNPSKHYRWEGLQEDTEYVESGFYTGSSWSCGVTKKIVKGERVFLTHLGDEPSGIVTSGSVERYDLFRDDVHPVRSDSSVYEAPYWEDQSEPIESSERTALYVNVRWDILLNSEYSIFSLSELERLNEGFPKRKMQNWTPENSGISVRGELAPKLESL